jgi:hypothetical protein
MRPTEVILGAVGFSPWVPVSYLQTPPNVAVIGTLSSGASLTYKAQHTFDDLSLRRFVGASQSAFTITITDSGNEGKGHGLSVGDYCDLQGTGKLMDGEYAVASIVSATQYTLTSLVSQTAVSSSGLVTTAKVYDNDTLVDMTTRGAADYNFPITAVRLNVIVWASGFCTLQVLQGSGSMS